MNIAELRRLEAEATPAPWDVSGLTVYDTCMDSVASTHSAADAALIVAMRNALPELLKALEKPVAWLCEDLILTDNVSVTRDGVLAAHRDKQSDVWRVTPLYALPPHGGVDV